jgi:hypothetical protein
VTSGLYYKHITIVNYDYSIISKWSSKHIDDVRVVIYDRNMFLIQATDGAIMSFFGYYTITNILHLSIYTSMNTFF